MKRKTARTGICRTLGMAILMTMASASVPDAVLAANPSLPAQAQARIDQVAQQALDQHQVTGISIAIADEDHGLLFARGYGQANLELSVPVVPDSVFRIGSITKQFTAAAMLQMADRGQLSLDDPFSKYYPDFPRGDQIKLRYLLNHTSGVHDFTEPFPENMSRNPITVDALVAHIATRGFDFDPGTQFAYDNSGYILASAVVEKVAGKPYRDYMRETFFQPLGLAHTAVDVNAEIVPLRSEGYRRDQDHPGTFLNADYSDMTVPQGAGAIRSTAPDVAKWTLALQNGRVIPQATLQRMTTPEKLTCKQDKNNTAPYCYGDGVYVGEQNGQKAIWHSGGIDGFNSRAVYLVKQKMVVVVLVNTESGAGKVAASVLDVVAPASTTK